jgi:ribosomal protein S7
MLRVTAAHELSAEFTREGLRLMEQWDLSAIERVVAEHMQTMPLIERLCRIFMQGRNGGKRAKQQKLITTALAEVSAAHKVHVFRLLIRVFANGYSFVQCRSAPKGGIRISKKVAHSVDKSIRSVCGALMKVTRKHDGTSALNRLKKELSNAFLGQDSFVVRLRDEGIKMAASANI